MTTTTGAYTTYSTDISANVKNALEKAVGLGVSYTPIAVATQVVAGTNYRIVCNAKAATPNADNRLCVVSIYESLQGEVKLTNVDDLMVSAQGAGGFKTFGAVGAEAANILKTATGVGVDYTPIAVATQVVAGTNYAFLCNAKAVVPGSSNKLALVKI
ncbi:MAG: hypothetical protein AAGK47_04110, partial [Bacteroidota bacterium]